MNIEPLVIAGLEVSMLLEVLVERMGKKGEPVVDAIKLILTKTLNHSTLVAGYVNTLLHWMVEERLAECGKPELSVGWLISIPPSFTHAPVAIKQRKNQITDACQENADRWHIL